MKASFPGKIVAIHPSAVYLGTVYTQDVIFAVEDGPKIEVYDGSRIVTPDMVGTMQDMELSPSVARITTSPTEDRRVALDQEDQPVFQGRVIDIRSGDDPSSGILDAGVGTICFPLSEVDGPVAVEDYMQIARAAITITDIDESRSLDETYAFFVDRLQTGDPEQRRQAARYLGTIGSECGIDAIGSALRSDDDSTVRTAAATALGRIGMGPYPPNTDRDPRIETELRDARSDETEAVAEAAKLALDDMEKAAEDPLHFRDW